MYISKTPTVDVFFDINIYDNKQNNFSKKNIKL